MLPHLRVAAAGVAVAIAYVGFPRHMRTRDASMPELRACVRFDGTQAIVELVNDGTRAALVTGTNFRGHVIGNWIDTDFDTEDLTGQAPRMVCPGTPLTLATYKLRDGRTTKGWTTAIKAELFGVTCDVEYERDVGESTTASLPLTYKTFADMLQ
jgi:hypothetical protein